MKLDNVKVNHTKHSIYMTLSKLDGQKINLLGLFYKPDDSVFEASSKISALFNQIMVQILIESHIAFSLAVIACPGWLKGHAMDVKLP